MPRTRALFQGGFRASNNPSAVVLLREVLLLSHSSIASLSDGSLLAHRWPRLLAARHRPTVRPLKRETRSVASSTISVHAVLRSNTTVPLQLRQVQGYPDMPGAVRSDVQPTVERDEVDDIFNYNAGIDATFNQPAQNWSAQDDANNNDTNRQQHDVPENIDEEVKVTKKRKPVAKLDEERYVPSYNTFELNH